MPHDSESLGYTLEESQVQAGRFCPSSLLQPAQGPLRPPHTNSAEPSAWSARKRLFQIGPAAGGCFKSKPPDHRGLVTCCQQRPTAVSTCQP